MTAPHADCSLYLHPEKPDYALDNVDAFIRQLTIQKFIAQPLIEKNPAAGYSIGDAFLNQIAFMGCAPTIKMAAENETDTQFCHIKIYQHDTARLISSKIQIRPPQCPRCKKPVDDWQDKLTDRTLYCEQCKTASDIEQFNWRKMAGFSRLFIEITDIFPKEAIPQTTLLDDLYQLTGIRWQYFYSCRY